MGDEREAALPDAMPDEDFLLALLNSTPVIDGVPLDTLADAARARAWLTSVGGQGTDAELARVREVRQALQAVVRGEQPPAVLGPALDGAACAPAIAGGQVSWTLSVAPERELAVRAVLAWDALARTALAACARAPTTSAACSSSTGPRRAPPGGAPWPPAATG